VLALQLRAQAALQPALPVQELGLVVERQAQPRPWAAEQEPVLVLLVVVEQPLVQEQQAEAQHRQALPQQPSQRPAEALRKCGRRSP
jgi:hypothetical protein